MFPTIYFSDDFSDLKGFLMPLIGSHLESDSKTTQKCMNLSSDSWSAEEND